MNSSRLVPLNSGSRVSVASRPRQRRHRAARQQNVAAAGYLIALALAWITIRREPASRGFRA